MQIKIKCARKTWQHSRYGKKNQKTLSSNTCYETRSLAQSPYKCFSSRSCCIPSLSYFKRAPVCHLRGKKGSRKCLSFMAFKIFIHLSMLIGTRCLQLQAQMVQNKHDSFFTEINYEQIQNLLSCSYFSLLRRKCVQGLNVIVFSWAAFSYFGTDFFKNSYRHLSSSTSLSKCPSCTHR